MTQFCVSSADKIWFLQLCCTLCILAVPPVYKGQLLASNSLGCAIEGHLLSRVAGAQIARRGPCTVKRLAGLCMAFTFRGAHTARGSFGSHLTSQRSSSGVGNTLGSNKPASTFASQSTRQSLRPPSFGNCNTHHCLHSGIGHAGTLPTAAASRAGTGKGSYSLARQHALSADTILRSRAAANEEYAASSRRTAASGPATATSCQDVQSATAFQTPPTYVRANGRIIASKRISHLTCISTLNIDVPIHRYRSIGV